MPLTGLSAPSSVTAGRELSVVAGISRDVGIVLFCLFFFRFQTALDRAEIMLRHSDFHDQNRRQPDIGQIIFDVVDFC